MVVLSGGVGSGGSVRDGGVSSDVDDGRSVLVGGSGWKLWFSPHPSPSLQPSPSLTLTPTLIAHSLMCVRVRMYMCTYTLLPPPVLPLTPSPPSVSICVHICMHLSICMQKLITQSHAA